MDTTSRRIEWMGRGSISVEAAAVLGVFALVILLFIGSIKLQHMGECLDQAMFEASKEMQMAIGLGTEDSGNDKSLEAIANGAYYRAIAEKSVRESLEGKNMDPGSVKLAVEDCGGGELILRGELGMSLGSRTLYRSSKTYHIVINGISAFGSDGEASVSVYGERYHESTCHTIRGHKGVRRITIAEAVEEGKTPCSICIGGMLFGKPYSGR